MPTIGAKKSTGEIARSGICYGAACEMKAPLAPFLLPGGRALLPKRPPTRDGRPWSPGAPR